MNEHLNSNSSRNSDTHNNNNGEQHCAAHPQRELSATQSKEKSTCKCGLDTGSRGWRYVYQTH